MSAITAHHVRAAAKVKVNESNLASVLVALNKYGGRFGMDRPHRLAQYFAQVMHKSGDFRYDREIWGRRQSSATTSAPISATRRRKMATAVSTRPNRHATHRQGQLSPVPQLVPRAWPRLPGLRQRSGCGQRRSSGRPSLVPIHSVLQQAEGGSMAN
nr:hypothetical protein [Sinorhizobium meliloti]